MNQVIEHEEVQAAQADKATTLSIVTDSAIMGRITHMAKIMASSRVTVPKHLQGNDGDCAAIIIQSMQWGMNHYAVAQKTHIVNGVLGYEAQLVNAVVQSSGAIVGSFKYEYKGEGAAVACRVGAVLRGESEITWGEWLSKSEVTVQNSPLWKTNPKQQLGYLQVKNWTRLYCPGALLGVYTVDELETIQPERDITPHRYTTGTEAAQAAIAEVDTGDSERAYWVEHLESVAASEGMLGYGDEWVKIGKDRRKLVGEDEHTRLKKIAEQFDLDAKKAKEDYTPGGEE